MKSIIEEFGDIASRLAQIEQDKIAEIATTKLPDGAPTEPDSSVKNWADVYGMDCA